MQSFRLCPFPSFRLVWNLPFSGSFMMIVHILRHKDRFRTSRNDKNKGGDRNKGDNF